MAQDKGYPPLSRSVEVRIEVVDRANNPPVWDHTLYGPIYVKENMAVGEKVVSVKARSVVFLFWPRKCREFFTLARHRFAVFFPYFEFFVSMFLVFLFFTCTRKSAPYARLGAQFNIFGRMSVWKPAYFYKSFWEADHRVLLRIDSFFVIFELILRPIFFQPLQHFLFCQGVFQVLWIRINREFWKTNSPDKSKFFKNTKMFSNNVFYD